MNQGENSVTTPQMPACPHCGQRIEAGAVFCSRCGQNIAQAQAAAAQVDFQAPPSCGPQCAYAPAQYAKASLGRRLGAHIIDALVALAPMLPGFLLLFSEKTLVVGIGWLVIAWLWAIWYGFTKDGMNDGKSIGKQACGLMVVHLPSNQPCTKGKSVLRQLSNLIPYVGIVEVILVLAHDKGHRLGDMFASTQVIAADQYRTY